MGVMIGMFVVHFLLISPSPSEDKPTAVQQQQQQEGKNSVGEGKKQSNSSGCAHLIEHNRHYGRRDWWWDYCRRKAPSNYSQGVSCTHPDALALWVSKAWKTNWTDKSADVFYRPVCLPPGGGRDHAVSTHWLRVLWADRGELLTHGSSIIGYDCNILNCVPMGDIKIKYQLLAYCKLRICVLQFVPYHSLLPGRHGRKGENGKETIND